jgi:hypothetical protein
MTAISGIARGDPTDSYVHSLEKNCALSLDELPRKFREAAKAPSSKAVGSIVALAAQQLGAVAAVACQQTSDWRLLPVHVYFPAMQRGAADTLLPDLMAAARAACETGCLKWMNSTTPQGYRVVAAPALDHDHPAGAIVFCLPPDIQPTDRVAATALYAAACLSLASVAQASSGRINQTNAPNGDDSIALLQILSRVAAAGNLSSALLLLVNELQTWLRCEKVCLAFSHGDSDARVAAISRVASFDQQSTLVAALESAARETMVLGCTQVVSGNDDTSVSTSLGDLCRQAGSPRAWSYPCKDAAGKTSCVCLVLLAKESPQDNSRLTLLSRSTDTFGALLGLLRQAHESLWRRSIRSTAHIWATLRRRRYIPLALALIVFLACMPWPYHLPCECVVEPVARRFVSAPFDGILDRTLVRPGDQVKAGDNLALMDGRELGMQLVSREALLDQARQRYQAALAKRDASAAQLALMEIQQAEQEVGLLSRRREQLAIRSPIDGIVVSGDLHRVQGAPLTVGQKLFEVAPLDRMIVEASVAEHEVSAVRYNMPVSLSLESHPGVPLRGTVKRLHPQAELRNQKSAFIAEVELAAADLSILPGMSGQAHINVGYRSFGWILFHRPWNYLRARFVW